MSLTTKRRERVLHLVREERERQVKMYGTNDDLSVGFGGNVHAYPWLLPYSDADGGRIEAAFRADYNIYKETHGGPTWMHLIREEVSELFAAENVENMVEEAIQVAALCVSLVEHLSRREGDLE